MKKLLLVAALIIASFPALAQAPATQEGPVAVGQLSAQTDPTGRITIVQTPPLQAPAPVSTIDGGGLAGQALLWVVTVFGGTIGTVLTGFLYKLMQKAGVQASEAMREKLQGIIVNGLNLAAARATQDLKGHGQIEIKNAAVASAVEYTKAHGAETLKALGLDPTSPEAVQAIKARIETAIADPSTPTAPALDDPAAEKKVAPVPVADAKLEAAATKV